jgi:large conductance mechanosensitive channel
VVFLVESNNQKAQVLAGRVQKWMRDSDIGNRGTTMLKEFRNFIMRGNVLDLAVAVIIGGAFVNDIIMPPIGLLLGKVDFRNLFVPLNGQSYPSLAAAKAAGAPTLNYGTFLNTVIEFLIVAIAIFLVLRAVSRLQQGIRKPTPVSAPTTKECPYCFSTIPIKATRCPNCTSELSATPPPTKA